MRRILLDLSDSTASIKDLNKEANKDKKKLTSTTKPVKISVVTSQNLNDFLKKDEKQVETKESNQIDFDSQRTISIDTCKQQTRLDLHTSIGKQPPTSSQNELEQIHTAVTAPKPIEDKRQRSEKIKSARSKLAQYKQSNKQFNQIFIIDRELAHEQKELSVRDTKVYFPYEPYKVQLEYMENVIEALEVRGNAVLESPTGTGKTLCLLASVLSFVEKQYRNQRVKHNVIYMSRTHTQLRQVQKQLSKTCYRPNMAIFASRDQLCLKENLSMLKGKEKIEACGKGVKLAKRIKVESMSEQDPKVLEAACFFHKERQEVIAIGKRKLANTLLDIEIMKDIGREEIFCPYFYPIQTKDFSTLFIMPYNYLLDAFLLNNYKEIIENSIIIFDEAHNISEAACEGRSLVLETHNFDSALLELNKLLSKFLSPSLESVRQMYEKQIKILVKMIEDWKQTFNDFIQGLYSKDNGSKRESGRDESEVRVVNKQKTDQALFELFCGSISDERKREFSQRKDFYKSMMISKMISPIEEFTSYGIALIQELKDTPDGVFSNFERVLIFALKVKTLLAPKVYKNVEKPWIEDEFNHFRLYVSRNSLGSNIIGSYVVGLRCLVPWLTFKDIIRFKPRSILLTSGTLKPLPMWEKELKLKFTKQLVNKHVIKDEQISAKIIKAGPSKVRFTFTYDNLSKNRTEIFKDLIEFLVQACSQIPNGILLIFPSFKIQMDFKYELMRSSKKEKLSSFKDIIFQEKNSDINMNEFKKKALSSKGVILAIICRGKVSEGIDFPDGMCRAVFIVGVPYPNIRDPFIIEKKNHLQNMASRCNDRSQVISGEEWYFMGTVRAVNQALGRVIRHAMDYGMIFLLDTRYCDSKMKKELPQWITQSMDAVETVQGSFYTSIHEFYVKMSNIYGVAEEKQYKEYQKEYQKEERVEKNALNILMNNRKRLRSKKIPSSSFDF